MTESLPDKILAHLQKVRHSQSPTEIGRALDYPPGNAAAFVAHALKSLLKDDKIEKRTIDGRIKYRYKP